MRSITRVDRAANGTTTSSASDYTCGLDGRVVARSTLRANNTRARRIDFAGLAEIRPDDGVFMLRVPLQGSVSVEDARSLSTGARVRALSGYIVSDARGSVLATTSFDTLPIAFTAETEFDAWGKKLTGYSTLASPKHGFAGAEPDEAVGTYSFGARTYDPTLRRWISPDPLLAGRPDIDEAVGPSLNLYAYGDGNPVKNTDKSGYCPVCEGLAAGALVGGFVQAIKYAATAPTNLSAGQFALGAAQSFSSGAWQGAAEAAKVLVAEAAAVKTVGVVLRAASAEAAVTKTAAAETEAAVAKGTSCFVAGTAVQTESGAQPIETILPGDRVWARLDESAAPQLSEVARTFVTVGASVLDVSVESESGLREHVLTTPEHPFWVVGQEWVGAADLHKGDVVSSLGTEHWRVEGTAPVAGEHPVYNLEVRGEHTYFVGGPQLWVHNQCITKAEQLKINAAKGAQGEAKAAVEVAAKQSNVQPQVTVRTSGGRTKVDLVGTDPATSAPKLTEVKSGNAKPNSNQVARFAEIGKEGGVVAGKGKPGYPGGTKIPPQMVDINRQ